ncbi:MAG: hypothetical protein ACJATI_002677 [Halioglobus sp.]|jgi:hypothetical protein
MLPDDQSLDGGNISIDGTSYTLKNVCPGNYTFTFIDNHGCKESEYVELEECDEESFDFNVETEVVDCNFDSPFSIYPDFDNHTDYYFEWSTGSVEHFIENVSAGDYTVTMTDSYGCSHIEQKSVNPLNPEDYASDFEITPTKIIAGTPPKWGTIEIDVQGSTTPVSIDWSCNDASILADVSEDGLTAYINQTDFEADLTVTVTDIYGCITEQVIKIQTCAGNSEEEYDIWYDPFEMKKCSDNFVGEIPINIDLSSLYVNYEIFK